MLADLTVPLPVNPWESHEIWIRVYILCLTRSALYSAIVASYVCDKVLSSCGFQRERLNIFYTHIYGFDAMNP